MKLADVLNVRKSICETPMKPALLTLGILFILLLAAGCATGDAIPNDIKLPGTQPEDILDLDSVDKCEQCHAGYDEAVEPYYSWSGSMMSNAARDPIFWGTMAVAEQDFKGSGDFCLRCHTTSGWLGGRSTPTDGSGLIEADAHGVECDFCHRLTNPDNSEYVGVQKAPFEAFERGETTIGYYGSGMYVLWEAQDKLGPYADAQAWHNFIKSNFHRTGEMCGTCHDVSNPAVGDLAPNNGAQEPLKPGSFSGTLGTPIEKKAAFNNLPFEFGAVERTFSEWKASLLDSTLVSNYNTLPADLRTGAIKRAYDSAIVAGTGGDYEDGTPRFFTCQTCHMRPVTGFGCNRSGTPLRKDLPLHDLTGGNYWTPDAIKYLDKQDKLRLGGDLSDFQISALDSAKVRAGEQLTSAARLAVSGNTLRVINLTGHKLISGYPEGRRMWLNIKWYAGNGELIREDGKYGPIGVRVNDVEVESIVDLEDPNTRIYEVHMAITQEWAEKLVSELESDPDMPLSFDRKTNEPYTLGELRDQEAGTYHDTFHFVLNDRASKDNRIPPYGMSYDEARLRNSLPVPEDQYGNPGAGGTYNYWDNLAMNPPSGATYATIDLLYQTTSWEYIQFLDLANEKKNEFLAEAGSNILEAWLNTDMSRPFVMTSTFWGTPPAK